MNFITKTNVFGIVNINDIPDSFPLFWKDREDKGGKGEGGL